MTFKHDANATNSSVYRALEKIAYQKGLVKADPIEKTASTKAPDLTPSKNLVQNVIKLCSALRREGLVSQAEEVEQHLMRFKAAAASSPDVDPEMIQKAHPKGGTQVSLVDGDAYVEDILEQHLMMLYVAVKPPKGKLSTAADIIGAVKIVCAIKNQDEIDDTVINEKVNKIYVDIFESMRDSVKKSDTLPANKSGEILASIDAVEAKLREPGVKVSAIRPTLKSLKNELSWKAFGDSLSRSEWSALVMHISRLEQVLVAYVAYDGADDNSKAPALTEDAKNPGAEKAPSDSLTMKRTQISKMTNKSKDIDTFAEELRRAFANLASWTKTVSIRERPEVAKDALAWIGRKQKDLELVKKKYDDLTPADQEAHIKDLLTALRKVTWVAPDDFETFRKEWIG